MTDIRPARQADPTPPHYTWQYLVQIALERMRELILAHVTAIFAAPARVPVPLLVPLLVDEVLLGKPGVWERAAAAGPRSYSRLYGSRQL
ncbi:MAG: hypothetical protein ACR2RB_01920 [Gammaproteobacteria bacterium]